ncbi:MAG: hypothetical protein ACKV19_27970 [Verrucomicrobiales bacterium]
MQTQSAIQVLALHEIEEADVNGVVLALDDRREATEAAGLVAAEGKTARDSALEKRAGLLLRDIRVEACVREVSAGIERPLRGAWLVAAVTLLALVLGFVTHQLGAGKVVNLLSIPLLGLIVWNLVVYLVWVGVEISSARSGHPPDGRVPGGLGGWMNRLLLRGAGVRMEQLILESDPSPQGTAAVVALARRAFLEKWLRVVRARAAVWVELAFHAGAVALAAGLVAGMYARGLSAEYKAAWESTFLRPPTVSAVLRTALGPASLVLGHEIPRGEAMQKLNIHDQEKIPPAQRESAAGWIHLYALTALIFIGLPRLGLISLMLRRGRRIDTRAPVEPAIAAAHTALVRQAGGLGIPAGILPFATDPEPARLAELRCAVRRLWPDTGAVAVQPTLAYGEEDDGLADLPWPAPAPPGPGHPSARLVLLMSLSATPEREVHGEFVRQLAARAMLAARDDQGVLAVALDARAFRRQFEGLPEADRRLRERRAAWEKVIEGAMESTFCEDTDFFIWRRVTGGR